MSTPSTWVRVLVTLEMREQARVFADRADLERAGWVGQIQTNARYTGRIGELAHRQTLGRRVTDDVGETTSPGDLLVDGAGWVDVKTQEINVAPRASFYLNFAEEQLVRSSPTIAWCFYRENRAEVVCVGWLPRDAIAKDWRRLEQGEPFRTAEGKTFRVKKTCRMVPVAALRPLSELGAAGDVGRPLAAQTALF